MASSNPPTGQNSTLTPPLVGMHYRASGQVPVPLRRLPPPDSDEHTTVVKQIVEVKEYLAHTLLPKFRQIREYWGLYLAEKKEFREDDEKWRANLFMPRPYISLRTASAVLVDLLNSGDPIIQADNVHDRDREAMLQIQHHLNYILACNKWFTLSSDVSSAAGIQGAAFVKVSRTRSTQVIRQTLDPELRDSFLQRVHEAELATRTRAPQDLESFLQWQKLINDQSLAVKVPDMPVAEEQEIVLYDGPSIRLESIFDLLFDPFVDDVQQQPLFAQRYRKPLSWVLANTGKGKMFSRAAVEMSAGKARDRRLSDEDRELAQLLGYTDDEADPRFRESVDLVEYFRPFADDGMRHPIVMNDAAIVNNDPWAMPFEHGMTPYLGVQNVRLPGHAIGLSHFHQNKDLFQEHNTLRSLRVDAVTLATLPVFGRASGVVLPEGFHKIRPGAILPAQSPNGIWQIVKSDPGLLAAFRELAEQAQEIDETEGTTSNVRGNPATVGRVSATEAERRLTQALVRPKERVIRTEEDWQALVPQMLLILHQFSSPQIQVEIGGGQPLAAYPRERLVEALKARFRFRGASSAIDRVVNAQKMMQFGSTFGQYLFPEEMRALMRRAWEGLGLKGSEEIVTDIRTRQLLAGSQAVTTPEQGQGQDQGQPQGQPQGQGQQQLGQAQGPGVRGDQASALVDQVMESLLGPGFGGAGRVGGGGAGGGQGGAPPAAGNGVG